MTDNDNLNIEHEQERYDEEDTDTLESMEKSLDEQGEESAEQEVEDEQSTPIEPLNQMPLELTLRCGALILSLGDLRRLVPGTILEVMGTLPGHATLCHGERVVAEGELVDIDGRLGLQLTRTAYQT